MMENLIQRGDLGQRLARGLEIKGQRTPVLSLDNVVVPMVLLEDLTRQSEFHSPKDRRAAFGIQQPAVAAELGGLALVNPATSGVIIVVETVTVSVAVAALIGLGEATEAAILATYGGIAGAARWLDSRNEGIPTAQIKNGTDAAGFLGTAGYDSQRIGSAAPYVLWTSVLGGGIVLRPAFGIVVECQTANLALNVGFRWSEINDR